jgi:Protein of unknown function (DUF998)
LVGIWGVGLIGAGAFVTDPVRGYPPGTPPMPVEATTSGALHDVSSVAAFFALGAASRPRWWQRPALGDLTSND